VATGTAPIVVASTTKVANLNADLLDGMTTVDEDNMASNSATSLPTQQSVKAYVDTEVAAAVTASDLDFQGDSGGALSIDLDSETLTIAGGTGLASVGSGNGVTLNIDSTVATLTGTQTLTNKSLTDATLIPTATTAGKLLFKEGTNNGTNAVTLIGPASTADVTVTLPAAADTLVGKATTDTLTNKTLGATTIAGHLIPNADETFDLGSSSLKFRDMFLSGSTITLGSAVLQSVGQTITLPANSTVAGGGLVDDTTYADGKVGYPASSTAIDTTLGSDLDCGAVTGVNLDAFGQLVAGEIGDLHDPIGSAPTVDLGTLAQ